VELINNKHGFCFVGCVCGLGGVCIGCGWGRKFMLRWAGFSKDPGFNSLTSYWFFKSTALVG
jgi:hypothetical protein